MAQSGWRGWLAAHRPGQPLRVHRQGPTGVEVSLRGPIRPPDAPLIGTLAQARRHGTAITIHHASPRTRTKLRVLGLDRCLTCPETHA